MGKLQPNYSQKRLTQSHYKVAHWNFFLSSFNSPHIEFCARWSRPVYGCCDCHTCVWTIVSALHFLTANVCPTQARYSCTIPFLSTQG